MTDPADRGTGLGASTRLLTRVLTGLMLPFVALGRLFSGAARLIAAGLAALWSPIQRLLQRCRIPRPSRAQMIVFAAVVAGLAAAALGVFAPQVALGIVTVVVGLVILVLVPVGAIAAPYVIGLGVRWLWRVAAPIRQRIARACRTLGRAFGRAFAHFAGYVAAALRAVSGALFAVVRSLGRAIGGAFRAVADALLTIVRPAIRALTRVAQVVGRAARAVRRVIVLSLRAAGNVVFAVVRPLGRAIGVVFRATAHAVMTVVRPAIRALTRVARVVGRAARAVGHTVVVALRALRGPVLAVVGPIARACAGAAGWCGRVARSAGQSVHTAARRLTHGVGVAVLQARARASQAPADRTPSTIARSRAPLDVPFEAIVYQNEYLPRGGAEVHAIVEVVARGAPHPDDAAPEAAEVILLDCSGSMGHPWKKLRAARHAAAAAVDALRDGTWFAIVRASHRAEPVYPLAEVMVQASPATRQEAKAALRLLWPDGGTAMSEWLLLTRELLASRPRAIRHAILLTDGKNESDPEHALERALETCAGTFQCDCRGVGTDWAVAELRAISTRMLGTVDIVADPGDLADDFRAMTAAAMAKSVAGATLRVWTPRGSALRSIKQVDPEIRDLAPLARDVDAYTDDFPTGAWGDERRQYHFVIDVPSRRSGEEMLAARVSLVVDGRVTSSALVRAVWTDDEQRSTLINGRVAHYTGQTELADAVQRGLAARAAGDHDVATSQLARATHLAAASGNDATLHLLRRVVEVDDASGTVQLKPHVDEADEMALDTRSTKTVPVLSLTRSA